MSVRYLLIIWVSVQSLTHVYAQAPQEAYAKMITQSDLKQNLSILASDALEGRETGTRGQKMAAAFISYHFQDLGLKPLVNGSYYQSFELYQSFPGTTYLQVNGARFRNFEDIVYVGNSTTDGETTMPVVFVGEGTTADYQQVNVAGKAVLVMPGDRGDYRSKISLAKSNKASMVFVLNSKSRQGFADYASRLRRYFSDGRLSLEKPGEDDGDSGYFFVAPAVAEKMFGMSQEKLSGYASAGSRNLLKKVAEARVTYRASVDTKVVRTENVLGFLEGTDKKDEVIVVSAHYDHIGKKQEGEGDLINNGADDDGSGTVTVMQLAKVFAQASKDGKGPRRSMLFMTVTGEEEGLLGSEYYTTHPVIPLENTVVDLNIDMIGRRDAQHRDSPPYVYVIGADKLSSELNRISESMNQKYSHLIFDYTYNDPGHPDRLYYRSDHWNFAQHNIPIIFYFDGIHEDYHMPSDEIGKIEFDLLEARARCVFYTAWEIANRDERIMPDAK
jgi:hypothetical protein